MTYTQARILAALFNANVRVQRALRWALQSAFVLALGPFVALATFLACLAYVAVTGASVHQVTARLPAIANRMDRATAAFFDVLLPHSRNHLAVVAVVGRLPRFGRLRPGVTLPHRWVWRRPARHAKIRR